MEFRVCIILWLPRINMYNESYNEAGVCVMQLSRKLSTWDVAKSLIVDIGTDAVVDWRFLETRLVLPIETLLRAAFVGNGCWSSDVALDVAGRSKYVDAEHEKFSKGVEPPPKKRRGNRIGQPSHRPREVVVENVSDGDESDVDRAASEHSSAVEGCGGGIATPPLPLPDSPLEGIATPLAPSPGSPIGGIETPPFASPDSPLGGYAPPLLDLPALPVPPGVDMSDDEGAGDDPPDRAKRGEFSYKWYSGKFTISRIRDRKKNKLIGWGATCGLHLNVGDSNKCKTTLNYRGLSDAEVQLRLKRWLALGVDISVHDLDGRTQHKAVLPYSLVAGLSLEELDLLADP
jgi:hypothetical protein